MDAMQNTLAAPAQNLRGAAVEPWPNCFGPARAGTPYPGVPAGRRVVSVWLQNPTDNPITVGVPATPSGQTFVVPPKSAGFYDIDPTKTVTFVNPNDANYAVYYAPT